MADGRDRRGGLEAIERIGNALPDPVTLFAVGALLVALGAEWAVASDWAVTKNLTRDVTAPLLTADGSPVVGADGEAVLQVVRDADGRPQREAVEVEVRARRLLDAEGLYWILGHLVSNFTAFPPLGIVLVGMLGIGLAERTGFIGAALKATLIAVPRGLLTPAVFLVGVLSSLGLDAGYVVLPPVAAALFQAAGRSPLVGIAAVFAGVAAGFSANLVVTSLDPLLAEFSTVSAGLLDPTYEVGARANLWFIRASTFLLTGVGWAVTAFWVEPRFVDKPAAEGGPTPPEEADPNAATLIPDETRGLWIAGGVTLLVLIVFALATWIPGAPLHGMDGKFPRWVRVIVPLLFLGFLIPGLVYGFVTGRLSNDRDVATAFGEIMASMGPYIVLAFFAAQFIAWFGHTNLGEMLAITGGRALASAGLPAPLLMVGFIGVVAIGNLFIGSMSAKYAFFAPVFVPMFMAAGISPELTQAAYRVGDSVSNVVTPLNPYVVIILTFLRRYVPSAGIGTLVALMIPYALAFGLVWSVLLAVWVALGIPLGPEGPLDYVAP
ncbi:MAG: AbgT family transporter [Myxococcota bacterium]